MQKALSSRAAVMFFLAFVAWLLVGCEEKKINQILGEPGRYANREVGIRGEVVESYSVLGRGAYRVDDGTGKLWVVSASSKEGVPRKGSHVAVRGKIKDGFDLGSVVKLPAQVGSGLIMIENSHRSRD